MPSDNKNNSNITKLPSEQITKLRDAFEVMDNDNDGIISDKDLKQIKQTTGKDLSKNEISKLLSSSKDPVSFSTFLALIANDLSQFPNSNELKRALQVFSNGDEIDTKELKNNLLAIGMKDNEFNGVLDRFKSERMNGDQVFMATEFLNFVSN